MDDLKATKHRTFAYIIYGVELRQSGCHFERYGEKQRPSGDDRGPQHPLQAHS